MKEELSKQQKNYILMRSIRDYGMGLILLCIGLYFFFAKKLTGKEVIEDRSLRYMLLIMFAVYGLFRMYRGFAKKYYREED